MRARRFFTFAFLTLALAGCAPRGFVETTANVIDEMTAFRDARRANTRESWERFIRTYPNSSKAQQARQWVSMMPDKRASQASLQEELRRAEREREENERRLIEQAEQAQAAREAEARRLEEDRKLQEAARLKQEEETKRLALEQQAQAGSEVALLLAELKKKEAALAQREADLKAREAALSAPAAPALADDIDVAPKGSVPTSDENFAVVIGIEKYRDIETKADYAERDARTMLLYLRDHMGYPEQNIIFLSGDRATRSDISKWLELWLPLQVTPESKVFVYFSGHGAPDTKSSQAYLLPYDGDPKALDFTAYALSRLYDKLNALQTKETIVALDSCFSGAGGRSVIPPGARPLMTRIETGTVSPKGGLTVFTASAGEEISGSYDAQRHGLFTYYFLRGLRGDADMDKDGWVNVQEQYDYIKKNVSVAARRNSREQTPQLIPDLSLQGAKASRRLSKAAK